MRIGHGYDVHRFGAGVQIVLGGVSIAHTKGLIAHSDGDVLLHAIADALLGAIGQGDIGKHFPDTDPDNANIDSRILLRRVVANVGEAGWEVVNVDATVIAQTPKLSPYIDAMRENIAADLEVSRDVANVKATTEEGMGFTGREEGIAAHAVVLLQAREE